MSKQGIGVYVHVPFCRSKCGYCDFYSIPPAGSHVDQYLTALAAEILQRAKKRPVRTLYVGGGTPSFIGAEALKAILRLFRSSFDFESDCEITVEANPNDVTADWLSAIRGEGVNRLSIGVQGVRDDDLAFLGRTHKVSDSVASVARAREAGFDNIGIDLIVGLPGHTAGKVEQEIREAVRTCAPEHISCYQLTCAKGTPLDRAVAAGEVRLLSADEQADIFIATHEACARLGYEGYEVSNFARRKELRSRHNCGYWECRDYLGFGPAAHSFVADRRSWNARSVEDYCNLLLSGKSPTTGEEMLTREQRATEVIMLGLRTKEGFSCKEVLSGFGYDVNSEKAEEIARAEAAGFIVRADERIRPTLKGMAIADSLARELTP